MIVDVNGKIISEKIPSFLNVTPKQSGKRRSRRERRKMRPWGSRTDSRGTRLSVCLGGRRCGWWFCPECGQVLQRLVPLWHFLQPIAWPYLLASHPNRGNVCAIASRSWKIRIIILLPLYFWSLHNQAPGLQDRLTASSSFHVVCCKKNLSHWQ